MPFSFGTTELLIILVIILLLLGIGRLSGLGSELGNAIRQFRQGIKGDEKHQ